MILAPFGILLISNHSPRPVVTTIPGNLSERMLI